MLNKILVAIDESASSESAFDEALSMAKALKAELLLVHVLEAFASDSPKQPMVSAASFLRGVESSAQQAYEQEWQQFENRYVTLLKRRQAQAETGGVAASYLQAQGAPEQQIRDIAKTHDIDLIVLGNRDRTNPNSISNYLVHHAPCSVTVVHPKANDGELSRANLSEAVAV